MRQLMDIILCLETHVHTKPFYGYVPPGSFDTLRSLVVVGVYTGRGDLIGVATNLALFGAPEVIGTPDHNLKNSKW